MAKGTATFTADFREEFEIERTSWLARRFLWWTGVMGVLGVVQFIWAVVFAYITLPGVALWPAVWVLSVNLAAVCVFVGAFQWGRRNGSSVARERMVWIVCWIVMGVGVLNLVEIPLQFIVAERAEIEGVSGSVQNWIAGWMANMMLIHLLASAFIPWTPKEAVRPLVPLVVFATLAIIAWAVVDAGAPWWLGVAIACFFPLIGVPGMLIAWWRHSSFRNKFLMTQLRGHYGAMKRELYDAQKVHESLFPAPIEEGSIQVRYTYEPMRQIGGDFVYAVVTGEGDNAVGNVVVIDVTGHGITAALTVNRLYGEIRRELAEEEGLTPGRLLTGINAYIHNTLAEHSVYATALCLRVDPANEELLWASAGHPPAFMLGVDGTMHDIDSTTLVLGAARDEDFQACERSMRFAAGDRVVAYTDGATESRDVTGKMLGVAGIRGLVDAHRGERGGRLVGMLMDSVRDRRVGPIQDDTLIVEVRCPVGG